MTYKPYAGIGSRDTPIETLELMEVIGRALDFHGFTLRSGGAIGADSAFESGAVSNDCGTQEIFLPWKGYNRKRNGIIPFVEGSETYRKAQAIASSMHPAWHKCSSGVRTLHTRNVAQILGRDLKSPSLFVICYTKGGRLIGGTAMAIKIAQMHNIPVFNMGCSDFSMDKLSENIRKIVKE